MRYFRVALFILICSFGVRSQVNYFPPNNSEIWEETPPTVLGYNLTKLDSLYDFLQSQHTKSFMVLVDGKIVLEKYFDTFTQDSTWYWASAGKSLTSVLIGLAQQDGLLNISDISSDYLGNGWTSCSLTDERKITIKNQITMTTGLDENTSDTFCTLPSCLSCLTTPGVRWAYYTAPYTKLDGVISSATGLNINTYLRRKIQTITGMGGSFVQRDYNNVYYSKTRSMARFGLLILNKGTWNGISILSDSIFYKEMSSSSTDINPSYGFLWWLNGKSAYKLPGYQYRFNGMLCPNAPHDMFSAMGKNGQILNIVPSKNMLVIRLGNSPNGSDISNVLTDSIWIFLNKVLLPQTISGINTTTGTNTISGVNTVTGTTTGTNTITGVNTVTGTMTGTNTLAGGNVSDSTSTSIFKQFSASNQFTIFPNPYLDHVDIASSSEEICDFEIYNLQGQVLQRGRFKNKTTIYIEPKQTLYLLRISNGSQSGIFKIFSQ